MIHRFLAVLLIQVLCICGTSEPLFAAQPKKYALLIAVTEYSDSAMNSPKLLFPEDDARAMGAFLEMYGYKCDYLFGEQATKANIEAKLIQLSGKSNQDGVMVLGLWGHGVEFDGGEAMFCPYDTTVHVVIDGNGNRLFKDDASGDELTEPNPTSLVAMSRFLSGLRICGAGNRLLLADCCRVKPNAARGRGAFGSKITAADLPPGTAAIFACAADQKAFEHDNWKHGALTKAMLDELPSIADRETSRVSDIVGRVSDSVALMVTAITRGREQQTIQPIMNGLPNMRLTRDMITNGIGMKLMLIPAGDFIMGSSLTPDEIEAKYPGSKLSNYTEEHPQHRVRVNKSYYMASTEVTVQQFRRFVEATAYESEAETDSKGGVSFDPKTNEFSTGAAFNWKNVGFVQSADQPVVNISLADAREFCKWISKMENRTYRLPTEDEWEFACRSGATTEFHFGSDASLLENFENVSHPSTQASKTLLRDVAQFPPNKYQLFDMHGNVSELCLGFSRFPLKLLAQQAYFDLENYLRRNDSRETWTRQESIFEYDNVKLRSGITYNLANDKEKVLVLLLWDFGCCNHHGCSLNAYDAIIEQCDPNRVSVFTVRLQSFPDSSKIDGLINGLPVIQDDGILNQLDANGFPSAIIVKPGGETFKVNSGGSFPDGGFAFDVTCATHLAVGSLTQWLQTQRVESWLKRYKDETRYRLAGEDPPAEPFVVRGGNWMSYPSECRSAHRTLGRSPHVLLGFRVVAELD